MNGIALVFVGLSTILGVCSQLALKRGMMELVGVSGKQMLLGIVRSPYVIGGLIAYGSGVVFWLVALSYLEVSYLYPFASLSYVGIIIGSYVLFKEDINRLRLLGIAIIILGVFITSQS